MYSDKSFFIFGLGAGNIWVIMKLEPILGLLEKEKGNLFSVIFFIRKFYFLIFLFRITIVNKLEFTNYYHYLWRRNNLNSLAVFMQLKMYIWEIPSRYAYNLFFL